MQKLLQLVQPPHHLYVAVICEKQIGVSKTIVHGKLIPRLHRSACLVADFLGRFIPVHQGNNPYRTGGKGRQDDKIEGIGEKIVLACFNERNITTPPAISIISNGMVETQYSGK